ncbi:hypothetical protein [Sutterella sp.]|uniref:hypothetical protein n=1 Tax=Sutterella sp. TaxID=1981025 RepID=UPI003FD7E518
MLRLLMTSAFLTLPLCAAAAGSPAFFAPTAPSVMSAPAEVARLESEVRRFPALPQPGTPAGDPARTPRAPALSAEPGSVVILVSSSMPPESLRAIARDARRLGVGLALSGLPVKVRRPDRADAALAQGDAALGTPFVADKAELARFMKPVLEEGAHAGVAPMVWHAVRDALPEEPAVPAMVFFESDVIELFPGDVRPLYWAALAAKRAQTESVRRRAAEMIRAAGLEDEARRLLP